MLITRTLDDSRPCIRVEITAFRGVAASTPYWFSEKDEETGVITPIALTDLTFRLVIHNGTPDAVGTTLYTFDSADGLDVDEAAGKITLSWTAAQASSLARGVHAMYLDAIYAGEVCARIWDGLWRQCG